MSVTLLVVDLWQHCIKSLCCIRSGVPRGDVNPIHILYGAPPVPYVPVRVTRGALIARTERTVERTPLSMSLWNDLSDPVFDGVGLAGSRARTMYFYWPQLLYHFLSSTVFPFLLFLTIPNQKFIVMATLRMVENRCLWSIMLGNANEAENLDLVIVDYPRNFLDWKLNYKQR